MRRAILAASALVLTAACSAAGASTTPAGSGSNPDPARAPVAAPGQPVQVSAQKAPGQPVAPAAPVAPAGRTAPAGTQQPGSQPSAAPGAGGPCLADAVPPVHKFCPDE